MASPYWGQLPGPRIVHHRAEAGSAAASASASAPASAPAPAQEPAQEPPAPAPVPELNPDQPASASFNSSSGSPASLPSPQARAIDAPSLSESRSRPAGAPSQAPPPQRRRSKRLQKSPRQLQKMESNPQTSNHRASVQSAVTNSTWDPLPTPTLNPTGLAPRPPSFPRGPGRLSDPASATTQQAGHDEMGSSSQYKRSHRSSARQPDEYDQDYDAPPSAPDAPRGPPSSYRNPQGNGYPQQAPAAAGPVPQEPQGEYYSRRGSSGDAPQRRASDASTSFARAQPPASVPLNVSASSGRRKVYADDRSPLQRLELTLGSYTKEEKRARMEAAEKRARERAALRAEQAASSTVPSSQPQLQSDRRASAGYQDPRPSQRQQLDPPHTVAPAAAVSSRAPKPDQSRGLPPSQGSQRRAVSTPQQYNSSAYVPAPSAEREPPLEAVAQEAGLPKRNLSFRQRAARDHTDLPNPPQGPVYAGEPQASTSGGLSLTRSGSNKLRKEPPGDPWYHRRIEAERRIPSVSKREPQGHSRSVSAKLPPQSTNKQLPPDPPDSLSSSEDDSRHDRSRAMGGVAGAGTAAAAIMAGRQHNDEPMSPGYSETEEKYMPTKTKRKDLRHWGYEEPPTQHPPPGVELARKRLEGEHEEDNHSADSSLQQQQQMAAYGHPENMTPGKGLYKPPQWLNEWEKGTVGTLAGPLLDLNDEVAAESDGDRNKAWWEGGAKHRRTSSAARARKAEAFDGEYDDTDAPTRFKPALHLKCGPLLRYSGIRQERVQTRASSLTSRTREMWRGSIMIVTKDSESSYEIAPTLRLFLQDMALLPPPPHHVNGDLPSEYVDPIAGHPKLGRRGETLFVRPVEDLQEGKDLSKDETDDGLFERTRSVSEASRGADVDQSGTYASRRARIPADGEKLQKYKDVRGFRLHAEQGCTFWRFNIQVELRERQQRIAYRINRGPAMGFWVPAEGQSMNMMFYSCNGFSLSAKPDEFSGPDPMWRDVLNTHQTQPFHVMIGGGDQIYNDCVADETDLFGDWLDIGHGHHKNERPFTPEMQQELEEFYLRRYCTWFSSGLFGLATSQIPMVNMFDDHDIFDGYGSYADSEMRSPVLCGLGATAFKYYMLFQQQSIIPETEVTEPSMIMGLKPGPYINELSRSLYVSMGGKVALLAVDARTERTEDEVVSSKTWEKIMNRLYAEVRRGQVEHLLVLLGVPIAYPRLVWLENILTSRLLDPVKALGKTGFLGKSLNSIDGGAEVLDDLNDHWTAKSHKRERSLVIEDLQDLAIDKSLRVTILSGDVHLAAVGQFFSNPKLGLAKHKDPRYMPNIISSAIANAPPPDLMADVLNKRNKIHHFDKQTDEDMIPIFQHGVDGKPRNNKRLMPHRNWCSIRQWQPGNTPPPSPPPEDYERSPSPSSGGGGVMGLVRRLSRSRSQSGRPEVPKDSVRGSRPPISGGGAGFFRSLSRRGSTSEQQQQQQPKKLTRTMSLGRDGQAEPQGERKGFFGSLVRRVSQRRNGEGDAHDRWGRDDRREDDYEDDDDYYYGDPRAYGDPRMQAPPQPSGLRGGGVQDEFSEGDEEYFSARPPRRAQTMGSQPQSTPAADAAFPPTRPFHRTPTGLSTKQLKKADNYEVDLEGGLDICLNVEVNPKDPTGITVPYRLLVPKLFYEYTPGDDDLSMATGGEKEGAGGRFKKLLSFRKKQRPAVRRDQEQEEYDSEDENDGWDRR